MKKFQNSVRAVTINSEFSLPGLINPSMCVCKETRCEWNFGVDWWSNHQLASAGHEKKVAYVLAAWGTTIMPLISAQVHCLLYTHTCFTFLD